ncbi:MAG: ABC transporter ATP-binding protein [Candidatus Omnitrophica bacterium]|nr:ABC transporter ATP-binding protein [Candidatus Omnitrophota bacterium]
MIISPADMEEKNNPHQLFKAIKLTGVSKKYSLAAGPRSKKAATEDFWALKDINLDIDPGQVVGIIGRNGAGKTTLLNIMAGILTPTAGNISVNGKVIGLFNLGIGFQDELSGKENIFLNGAILGAQRREIEGSLNSIIEFSELGDFINMPLGSYSQGMRLRLGFSIIANLDFDILVIDEVLAVGDALFQNKCFQRLIDFKRRGKTLIITTQAMDLIERLCDKVMLLDHGFLLFSGEVLEGINKYKSLLNTEKFFVGVTKQKKPSLIENTKKWADNISDWGNKFGGKEVVINSVEFFNQAGRKTNCINTQSALRIKVSFAAKDRVEKPHFGVAIFRKDGVYCYGPNTKFDNYIIPELKQGEGFFTLDYPSLLLAGGEYKVSVAIWDENESLAFDHHYGYYDLVVVGEDHQAGGFLNMPFEISYSGAGCGFFSFLSRKRKKTDINLDLLEDKFGQTLENNNIKVEYVKFLDHSGSKKDIFMTNERVKFTIGLEVKQPVNKGLYLWAGIYRDDGIYCQGLTLPLKGCKNYNILFPKFSLLPGHYCVSLGIWDSVENKFLMYQHGVYLLKMVFDKPDHGTIYLGHKWRWENSQDG